MLIFAKEKFADIRDELPPLFELQYDELALNKDTIALNPDYDTYENCEQANFLHLVTARDEGKLVGYSMYFVIPNLHYRQVLQAESDIYFLLPEYRKGMNGIKLIKASEAMLYELGVRKVQTRVKRHKDVGLVFERLGYSPIEDVYSKVLR